MAHRCVVERDMAVGQDDWGDAPEPDWQVHLDDQPCFVWYERGLEVHDGRKTASIDNCRAIVPIGTDLANEDRLVRVNDRRGREVVSGPLRVESIGRRRDHLDVTLEVVA